MNNNNEKIKYFLYARKSSESEDRQMQSIEDQIRYLKELAFKYDIEIIDILEESKSAKAPGIRPVYQKMIERIKNGEATGILTWHLNRLSRNAVDSGKLSWMLQNSTIEKIQTIDKFYLPEDNVILFSVETAAANQFIIDLRKNSIRGTESKAQKGWLPSRAPTGYKNVGNTKGEKTIEIDEERFHLVRKMWDMVLEGERISDILRTVNKDWGLTTRKFRNSGGKELSKSVIYRIFSNVFYTGKFLYKGKLYEGKHTPMVSQEEFDTVQKLLQRTNSPRPYKQDFAYTGIIKCGCGCENSITAERTKKDLVSGEINEHIYYRSTRRKKLKKCIQKPVTEKELSSQVIEKLGKVEIRQEFLDWAFEIIDNNVENEVQNQEKINEMKKSTVSQKEKELSNLKVMMMKEFIKEDEFLDMRRKLDEEIEQLKNTQAQELKTKQKRESLKNSLVIISRAKSKIENSNDPNEKKKVLSYFGYNHILLNKEFNLTVEDWLVPVLTNYKNIESEYDRLEPEKTLMKQRKNEHLELACPSWGGYRELNPNCRYHKPE